jgi:hypothetical protein
MKKFVIATGIVTILAIIVVVFQIPERINYALHGMGSYNLDGFTVSDSHVNETNKVNLDMSVYIGNEIEIANLNSTVKLVITKVEYTGSGYKLYISSTGNSSFNAGEVIVLDNVADFTIESNCGIMTFQVSGKGSLEGSNIEYICDIYPVDETQLEKLPKLKCEFTIPDLTLRVFERRK